MDDRPNHQDENSQRWSKGENQVFLREKKDRSLTAPLYKRRMAMDQPSTNNYVPFVPFPPDYFSEGKSINSTDTFSEDSGGAGKEAEHWRGKSLEGSAVKEVDPLDMEAKAERWFRRVAQIKDIKELSEIPDEDFPTIMPMRKGVNRFVVSKRKTPLERRLASSQCRGNLPVMSFEAPIKDVEEVEG